MVNNNPAGNGPHHGAFSAELADDIAAALAGSLSASGGTQDAALDALAHRVCAEAKVLAFPPEKMLIAIKHLFERISLPELPHSDRRRQTFEKFISGCIESYFNADE